MENRLFTTIHYVNYWVKKGNSKIIIFNNKKKNKKMSSDINIIDKNNGNIEKGNYYYVNIHTYYIKRCCLPHKSFHKLLFKKAL